MRLLLLILLILFSTALIFSRLIHIRMVYRNKQAARKYCRRENLHYVDAVAIDPNMRLHFTKNGISAYADFKTDGYFDIIWLHGTPIGIYDAIVSQSMNKSLNK